MTPGLLLPVALTALAAAIVPLVIHIARRSEQHPTDFAALRWLRQKPKPRSRLRFDEWPLLALRLLLLTLLAVWLAKPVLFGAVDRQPWVAVAPGVDLAQAGMVDDKPVAEYGAAHWLAPGFPALKEDRPAAAVPLASLVRQLDADLPAGRPLIVVAPSLIEGADAERPRLSRRIEWRIVPGAMVARPITPPPPPALSIRQDAGHQGSLRYLRAAASAWQPVGRAVDLEIGGLDTPLPEARRPVIWLGSGTLPASLIQWVEKGGRALIATDALFPGGAPRAVLWRDDLGRPLVEAAPMGSGRLMRFNRPLAPAEMPELLQPEFPARLKALFDATPAPPTRVAATDYSPSTGARHFDPSPRDLQPWLAVLIGLILLAERWLATRRSRGMVP